MNGWLLLSHSDIILHMYSAQYNQHHDFHLMFHTVINYHNKQVL